MSMSVSQLIFMMVFETWCDFIYFVSYSSRILLQIVFIFYNTKNNAYAFSLKYSSFPCPDFISRVSWNVSFSSQKNTEKGKRNYRTFSQKNWEDTCTDRSYARSGAWSCSFYSNHYAPFWIDHSRLSWNIFTSRREYENPARILFSHETLGTYSWTAKTWIFSLYTTIYSSVWRRDGRVVFWVWCTHLSLEYLYKHQKLNGSSLFFPRNASSFYIFFFAEYQSKTPPKRKGSVYSIQRVIHSVPKR